MTEDSSGLNLFDDAASAVGNFPAALRGYDRNAVDDYVRSLEARVVQANRTARHQVEQVAKLREELGIRTKAGEEIDFAVLGGRAKEILTVAEQQARDVVAHATAEAEQTRENARRDADAVRDTASRERDQVVGTAQEEMARLHEQGKRDVAEQVERARTDATTIVAAAERAAESLRREAEHLAESTRQRGYLDAQEKVRAAEAEAARTREAVATEREDALTQLRAQHTEAVEATGRLLAETTVQHRESGERIAADVEAAASARSQAEAEAAVIVSRATARAEERENAALRRADEMTERTQREFAWRREQLQHETERLSERKRAVLSQLHALSELVTQSPSDLPDLRPLADLGDGLPEPDAPQVSADQPDEASTLVQAAVDAVQAEEAADREETQVLRLPREAESEASQNGASAVRTPRAPAR